MKNVEIPDWLRHIIQRGYRFRKLNNSETYMREFYISPVLGFALDQSKRLNIYSDEYQFRISERLSGTPDYVISYMQGPRRINDPDQRPLVAIAEAKKENFSAGWGQCLAQMVAAQQVIQNSDVPVWGIVTTGLQWEFGYLKEKVFYFNERSVDLDPLEHLISTVLHVFDECEKNGAAFEANQTKLR